MVKAQKAEETPQKVEQLQSQLKDLQKENERLNQKLANSQAGDIFKDVKEENGISYIAAKAAVNDMTQLRQLADKWKQQHISDVLVLGMAQDGKANLLVAMSDQMVDKGLKAGDLIKAIAPKINGGGGGRPNMAQAGGKNPAGLQEAFSEVANWLQNQ